MEKRLLVFDITIFMAALAAFMGCVSTKSPEPYNEAIQYKLVVEGYEWGPAISKVVLIFKENVSGNSLEDGTFTVLAGETPRSIVKTYVSDEKGESRNSGNCITIELKTGYADAAAQPPMGGPIENSSPFTYDFMSGRNEWLPLNTYAISTNEGRSVVIGGRARTFTVPSENFIGKISPSTDNLVKSFHAFGNYRLNYASYEPVAFKSDRGSNPLIIWLHGAGGGSPIDIDIALYDSDVTTMIEPKIQSYFKRDGLEGAYVLYPQVPTWWMDNGKGEMTAQGPDSAFTEGLKSLIDSYIGENPDIDTNRIYIGGCSNGGYMTVNMPLHYPGFFAAAFPICEAFLDSELTDEAIASLAKESIWFTQAADDPIVRPEPYVLGTYTRLIKAGAKNVHLSYFENVIGQDVPGMGYFGHWSWIYVLQDRAFLDQDIEAVLSGGVDAIQMPSDTPVNINGVNSTLWGWLAEQKK